MVGYTFQFEWEVKLMEWCQNYIPEFAIKLLSFLSNAGDTLCVVAILAFVYLCYDKRAGKKIAFNAIIGLFFSSELKNIFERRRPYFDNKNIKCLKIVDKDYDLYDARKQGFSFPSMHSLNAVAVFGTLYEHYRKKILLIVAIVISLIVGTSRFVLGCHYPTDVIVGWLLGIMSVVVFGKIFDKLNDKQANILLLLIGTVGVFFCTSTDFYSSYGVAIGYVISTTIDKKYINFKTTKSIPRIIARLALAGLVFVAISNGLKLLLPSEVIDAETAFAYFYRTFRYALSTTLALGLTPMIYKYNILKIKEN